MGIRDAPVVFHRSLRKRPATSEDSPGKVGLRFEVLSSGPFPCFVFRMAGGGAISTHIDDILGCGEPGVLSETQKFPTPRFERPEVREQFSAHVGMELTHEDIRAVSQAHEAFTENLEAILATPEL